MTKEEEKQKKLELRAIKLVFDYYRYFLNCDEAAHFGGVIRGYSYGYTGGVWGKITPTPTIWLYKYKTPAKRKEVERMRSLLSLSPDLEVVEDTTKYNYELKVTWVNPELPSIKNNSLGFERNVDTEQKVAGRENES